MKAKIIKVLSLLVLGSLMTGCVVNQDFKAYVVADRLDHDVFSIHYTQLVTGSSLSEEDKATHLARLSAKGKMLNAAEDLLGIKK